MTLSTPPPPSVIKKTLSCTFLFVFLTTSLTPPYVEASIGKFRNTERSSHFSIPPTLANVSETYWPLVNGPEPLTVKGRVFPFVLHIQDAHEIFEAQKALSTLLETLQQQNQLPKVLCVEGAWGKIDLSWIRNIPEEEAKRRLADRLLKEGLMTGEEHFASLCEPPVPVVGVDDAILHGKNAKARAAIAEDTRLVTSVIQDARYQLSLLEKKRLSPPLFEFLNARKKWENDAGHIKEYTGALSRMWGKDEFNTLWPTLDRFQEMATLEPIVLAQKEDLLRSVRKTEDIDQIDPRVVRDILRYRTLAQETNPHEILKETARCDRETMNKIAVSGTLEERRLAELDEWLALTEKLWALAMTPDDWERYQQIRPHWGREKMAKTLRDFTILPWPQRADGQERFWNGLVHAEDFYRVALERNEALARSTMETARQFNGQAVLIAGGFHSPGMAKLFRESGSSYAIVAPDFQQNTENHLRKVSALFAPNEDQRQRIEQDLTTLFPPGKARELSDQFEKRALPGSHRKKRSFLSPAWVHGAVVATVIAFRVLLWMTVAPLALAADGGGGVDALLTATAVVPLVLELAVALGRRTLKPATDPNTDAPSPPPTETPSLSQLISNKLFDEALTLIRKRFVTDEISAGRLFLELNDDEKQTLMENAPWDSNEKGLLMACVWQAARQKDIRDQRKLLSLQKEISQKTSRPSEAVKEITEQIRILNEQLDAMQALQSHFETFADQGEIPLWCREFLKTLTETEKKARATALEWRLAFVKSPETLPTDVVREETKGMTVFLRALLSPAPVLRLSDRRAWADSYLWAKESSKLYWLYHVPQFGRLESNAMTAAWKAARRPPAGLSPVPPPRKEDVGSFEEIVKSARGNLHNNVLDNKALVVLPEPEDILAFTTELARQEHNTDRSRKTYLFDLGVYWRNHSQDIPERNGLVEVMDLLAQRGNAVLVINMENFRYEDATLVETALKIREKKGPPVVLAVGRHTMNSQLKPDRLSHIAGITEIPEDQRRARLTDGLQREIQGISDEQGTPLPSQDLLQDLDLGPFLGLPDLLAKLRRLFEEMAASQTRDRAFLTTRNRMSAFLERMRAEPPTGPRAAELQRKIEGLQQQLLVSEPRTLALGVTKERRPTDAQIVQSALYAMASDLPFVEQVTLALTRMPPDAAVQVRRFLSEYTQYLRSQSTQEATKRLGWLQSALQLFPLLPPDQPTPLSGEEDIYDRAARLLGLSHSGTSAMLDFINRQITAQLLAEKGATRTLPTALLLGPHGTGKTTLTKSMATILRRKLVFLSLGNITDTRQAAGHSSVYQGAVDGTLAQKIRLLLSAWALVVLDEIDKAPMDVQNLFLPVFDFQRAFYDNFYAFNLPIERLMFIATANYADRISGPLLDRMVVIRLPGYVREEKIKIALHYILPNIFQKYGITNDEVAIPDVQGLLDHLLSHHDFEPGVRRLETLLEAVVVGAAIDWVKSSRSNAIVLTPDQAQNYLPPPTNAPPRIPAKDHVGVAHFLSQGRIRPVSADKKKDRELGADRVFATEDSIHEAARLVLARLGEEGKELVLDIPVSPSEEETDCQLALWLAARSHLDQKTLRREAVVLSELDKENLLVAIGDAQKFEGIPGRVIAGFNAGSRLMVLPAGHRDQIMDSVVEESPAMRGPLLEQQDRGRGRLYLPRSFSAVTALGVPFTPPSEEWAKTLANAIKEKGVSEIAGDPRSGQYLVIEGPYDVMESFAETAALKGDAGSPRCLYVFAKNAETVYNLLKRENHPAVLAAGEEKNTPEPFVPPAQEKEETDPSEPSQPLSEEVPPEEHRLKTLPVSVPFPNGTLVDVPSKALGDPKRMAEGMLDGMAARVQSVLGVDIPAEQQTEGMAHAMGMFEATLLYLLTRDPRIAGAIARFLEELPESTPGEESLPSSPSQKLVAMAAARLFSDELLGVLAYHAARHPNEYFLGISEEFRESVFTLISLLQGKTSGFQTDPTKALACLNKGLPAVLPFQMDPDEKTAIDNLLTNHKTTALWMEMDEREKTRAANLLRRLLLIAYVRKLNVAENPLNDSEANGLMILDRLNLFLDDTARTEKIARAFDAEDSLETWRKSGALVPEQILVAPSDEDPMDDVMENVGVSLAHHLSYTKDRSLAILSCPRTLENKIAPWIARRLWLEGRPRRVFSIIPARLSQGKNTQQLVSECLGLVKAAREAGNSVLVVDLRDLQFHNLGDAKTISRLLEEAETGPQPLPIVFITDEASHSQMRDISAYAAHVGMARAGEGVSAEKMALVVLNNGLKSDANPPLTRHVETEIRNNRLSVADLEEVLGDQGFQRSPSVTTFQTSLDKVRVYQRENKSRLDVSERFRLEYSRLPPSVKTLVKNLIGQWRTKGPQEKAQMDFRVRQILDFPWGDAPSGPKKPVPLLRDNADTIAQKLDHLNTCLNQTHDGMESAKQAVGRFLFRREQARSLDKGLADKKTATDQNPPSNEVKQAILFVSSPGVGKTTMAKSIARALGMPDFEIKPDSADQLNGTSSGYLGSEQSVVMQKLTRLGTKRAVGILDEIDKIRSDKKAEVSATLLRLFDPAQNHAVLDNHTTVEYDASEVLWIATANSLDDIPPELLSRFEVIELPSYSGEDKQRIGVAHSLPKILQGFGLTLPSGHADVVQAAVNRTTDGGARGMERLLESAVLDAVQQVKRKRVEELTAEGIIAQLSSLPAPPPSTDVISETYKTGHAHGLAVMGEGNGVLLPIQADLIPNKGKSTKVRLTDYGRMKGPMKRSAQRAFHVALDSAPRYGGWTGGGLLTLSSHLLSIQKDGDSAGVAFVTAMVSALTKRRIRQDAVMTGTVQVGGTVDAVGKVPAKLGCGMRKGAKLFILPQKNENALNEFLNAGGFRSPHAVEERSGEEGSDQKKEWRRTLRIHVSSLGDKGPTDITTSATHHNTVASLNTNGLWLDVIGTPDDVKAVEEELAKAHPALRTRNPPLFVMIDNTDDALDRLLEPADSPPDSLPTNEPPGNDPKGTPGSTRAGAMASVALAGALALAGAPLALAGEATHVATQNILIENSQSSVQGPLGEWNSNSDSLSLLVTGLRALAFQNPTEEELMRSALETLENGPSLSPQQRERLSQIYRGTLDITPTPALWAMKAPFEQQFGPIETHPTATKTLSDIVDTIVIQTTQS